MNITVIAKDNTKVITKYKFITIDEPTFTNKVENTLTGFSIKAIALGDDKEIQQITLIIFMILSSVTVSIMFTRKKRKKKGLKRETLFIVSTIGIVLITIYFRLDKLVTFVENPVTRFVSVIGFVIIASLTLFLGIRKKYP